LDDRPALTARRAASRRSSRRRAWRRTLGAALAVVALMAAALAVIRLVPASPDEGAESATPTSAPFSGNLVANAGFEQGLVGWEVHGGTIMQAVTPGRGSGSAVRVQADFIGSTTPAGAPRRGNPRISTTVGGRMSDPGVVVTATVWVRAPDPPVTATVRLAELTGMGDPVGSNDFEQRLGDTDWHQLAVEYTTARSGSVVELGVGGVEVGERQVILVDTVEARRSP
jgi:hypothetical protein